MKKLALAVLLLIFIAIAIAFAQYTPTPGSGPGKCVGFPGNTNGVYLSTCQPSDVTGAYLCSNSGGCTVAADWTIAWPQLPTNGLVLDVQGNCVLAGCASPTNGSAMSNGFGGGNAWYGLSPGGSTYITWSSGTGGSAPTWAASQINGFGAWAFTNCPCAINYGSIANPNGAQTAIAVINNPAQQSGSRPIFGGGTSSMEFGINSTGNLYVNQSSVTGMGTSTSTISPTTWYLVQASVAVSGAKATFRINNAADATVGGSNGAISATTNFLGFANAAGTSAITFFAAVLYTRQISVAESQQVYNYFHLLTGGAI